ncbi:MAG: AAA family ATPase [Leptospira sp.]|nr:AAA family ATPase [Leptospira sp.]
MARVFPENLSADYLKDHKSNAELRLYEALKHLNDEYSIYYSRTWIYKERGGTVQQGEADFVIAHPVRGILILEVKGGRIEIDSRAGKYYTINKEDQRFVIKNPWKQAETSKFILLKKIQSHPMWRQRWIDIGSCVAFSDLYSDSFQIDTLEHPKEIVIFKDHLKSSVIQTKIESIYDHWSKKKELGYDGMEYLQKLLAPSLVIQNPLQRELQETQREMIKLEQKQYEFLDLMKDNQRVLIEGGAGSGKTVALMEKARILSEEGLKTLIVSFSPKLADFLKNSAIQNENLHIHSFTSLITELCKETVIMNPHEGKNPFSLNWEEKEELSNILLDCIEQTGSRYEAILVDEGQDFHEDWWTGMELLLSDTPEKYFYIFYDKSQIIDNKKVEFPNYMTKFSFRKNIRNTKQIHNLASKYFRGDKMHSSEVDGPEVQLITISTEANAPEKVLSTINGLHSNERISLDQIAVLTPHPLKTEFEAGKKWGNYTIYNSLNSQPPTNGILVDTILEFKGLERPIVILTGLEKITMPGSLSLTELYVGCTRPRSKLIIVATDRVVRYLQR